MPRWMAAHPHLSSSLLAWRNAYRDRRGRTHPGRGAHRRRGSVWLAVLPPTGPILGWLGENWAVTFVIAASSSRCRPHAADNMPRSRRQHPGWPLCRAAFRPNAGDLARRRRVGRRSSRSPRWSGQSAPSTAPTLHESPSPPPQARSWVLLARLADCRARGSERRAFTTPSCAAPAPAGRALPSLSPLANWPAAQGRIFSRPKKTAPMRAPRHDRHSDGQSRSGRTGRRRSLHGCSSACSLCRSRRCGSPSRRRAGWRRRTVGKWRFIVALIWRLVLIQALALAVVLF